MHIDLTVKRVFVTGGNSGLGAAIADAFAVEGASVANNYLVNPDATDVLLDKYGSAGGKALGLLADIGDADAVARMFAQLDEAWGGIDILINNAGVDGHAALGWEGDVAQWGKVIDVNLKGAYHCAREALKRMVAPKGRRHHQHIERS